MTPYDQDRRVYGRVFPDEKADLMMKQIGNDHYGDISTKTMLLQLDILARIADALETVNERLEAIDDTLVECFEIRGNPDATDPR